MSVEAGTGSSDSSSSSSLARFIPWIWAIATAAAIAIFVFLLRTDPQPGVERLALARTAKAGERLIDGWKESAQLASARRAMSWDFGFMAAYGLTIGFLIHWGYARFRTATRRSWRRSAMSLLLIGIACDIAEDALMLKATDTGLSPNSYAALYSLSIAKFIAIGLAVAIGIVVALQRIAVAIDEHLERNRVGRRTQLAPSEQAQEAAGMRQLGRSALLRFLAWLVGALRPRPVAPPQESVGDLPRSVGICLSGGGIRSAAFNLGALQALQERGILEEADYLSAVSGGAYIASAFALVNAHTDPSLLAETPAFAPDSPEATYLLNHAAYLGPAGLSGKVWMILRTLMGVAVNLAFIAAPLFILGTLLGWWYRLPFQKPFGAHSVGLSFDLWRWISLAVPAGLAVLLIAGDLFSNPTELGYRLLRTWSRRLLGLAVLLGLILVALPALVYVTIHAQFAGFKLQTPEIPSAGVVGMLAGAIQAFVGKRRLLFAMIAGAVIAPLTLLVALVLFTKIAAGGQGPTQPALWVLIGVGVAALIGYAFSDLTTWSPHPFYKRALWGSFGLRRVQGPQEPVAERLSYDANVALTSLNPGEDGRNPFPELIICAAANIADEGATPPGRSATSFTFSARGVGGRVARWLPIEEYERMLWPDLRLISVNSAVAITGAAISPSMGKMTKRPIRFLLAMLNIRLGVWLPNPLWQSWWQSLVERIERGGWRGFIDRLRTRPRPRFLLREALGQNRLSSKFLYVSDGGHYENLGLVELVRRGCTEIYCFDASGDQPNTFETLGEAIALARTDYQAEITFNAAEMNEMKQNSEGYAIRDFVRGQIEYLPIGGQPRTGTLFYAKSLVTDRSSLDVKSFKASDKRFPNHSTMDQFFNERKFEAYRALGADIARRIAERRPPAASA